MDFNNTYVIGDNHFNHKKILNFTDSNGKKIRNFLSVDEMDEHMIDCWNSVIKDNETLVYHIGDVAMRDKVKWMDANWHRLNGRKILICGNHDTTIPEFCEKGFFEDVLASTVISELGFLITHFPVHQISIGKSLLNIHGHIHQRKIDDGRYFCASVEHLEYTPKTLQSIYDETITPQRQAVLDKLRETGERWA